MKNLLLGATIAAMLRTVIATMVMITFCLLGGANSTPAQIRAIKLWMGGLSLLSVVGIGSGILLLRSGQPGWAAGVNLLPTVVMILILGVALLK